MTDDDKSQTQVCTYRRTASMHASSAIYTYTYVYIPNRVNFIKNLCLPNLFPNFYSIDPISSLKKTIQDQSGPCVYFFIKVYLCMCLSNKYLKKILKKSLLCTSLWLQQRAYEKTQTKQVIFIIKKKMVGWCKNTS